MQKIVSAFTPDKHSKEATERLLKELKDLRGPDTASEGFSVEPVSDNIYKVGPSNFLISCHFINNILFQSNGKGAEIYLFIYLNYSPNLSSGMSSFLALKRRRQSEQTSSCMKVPQAETMCFWK